ncbi:serine hydroxymethyltransferase, partial [Staphylococcus argenteus]|nr:serine hydroxymethyltransferase [Staphylococcus argenteus]
KEAEEALDSVGSTCNENSVPFDQEKPVVTSGIRVGPPAATRRGFDEDAFEEVATVISLALQNWKVEEKFQQANEFVAELTAEYSLYQ